MKLGVLFSEKFSYKETFIKELTFMIKVKSKSLQIKLK